MVSADVIEVEPRGEDVDGIKHLRPIEVFIDQSALAETVQT